jgi:hypothetical protein
LEEFVRIAVGVPDAFPAKADYTLGMESIARSLTEHGIELAELWDHQGDAEFVRIAPTCARLLLEQSLATILGRLDPIRFISIVRGSRSPDFQIGGRNPSSFNWASDVLPSIKPAASGLWSQDMLRALCRGVLDGHLADYLFGSHHEALRDKLTDVVAGRVSLPTWVINLLKLERGEHCLHLVRKKAGECYSSLSKGMHFEFFKDHATRPTAPEVVTAIRDTITVAATCALYSHFTDISLQKIPHEAAIECFLTLTTKFQCQ